MKALLKPPESYTGTETSYGTEFDDQKVGVVLTGYIGRIDNYAKRRLGDEIEQRLDQLEDL